MCFSRRSIRDERVDEGRQEAVWDLFDREPDNEVRRPVPVTERDRDEEAEPERDKVPAGAGS